MEEDSGHEGLSHKRRTKQIRYYFNLGLQHQEILCFLEKYHNISISLRTLKRDLRWMNLYRRNSYSNVEVVANLIEQQVRKSGQLHGYKWMHLKCIQAGLRVKQTTVSSLLQILDPLGVDMRKRRRLRRRVYSNQGPNYLWHVDGYDKLKPYGICISGCVDGFSRHIMWLNAASTNKNPEVIAGFYIKTLQMLGGFPRTIRCDMGTENGHLENMQIFFRRGNEIDHDTMPPFLYGTSQANQRIESWWCILRKHNAQFWMNLFEQLKDDGLFTGSFIDKSLIQYCFLHIIQIDIEVISNIADSDLAKYLPKYGDRLATKQFCLRMTANVKKNSKESLLEKLKGKVQHKLKSEKRHRCASSSEDDSRSQTKRNSNLGEVQIGLGWMISLDGDKFRQVREKSGGGTRMVQVKKSATKTDLIRKGIDLFFPNNISTKGPLHDFSLNILDFKSVPLDDKITVAEVLRLTCFPKIRFYFATREKCHTVVSNSQQSTNPLPDIELHSYNLHDHLYTSTRVSASFPCPQENDFKNDGIAEVVKEVNLTHFSPDQCEKISLEILDPELIPSIATETIITLDGLEEVPLFSIRDTTIEGDINTTDSTTPSTKQPNRTLLNRSIRYSFSDTDEDNNNNTLTTGMETCRNRKLLDPPAVTEEMKPVNINRERILDEMFEIYEDRMIARKSLNVSFKGEKGLDSGGLTKELFSLFWRQICNQFFSGEDGLVPYLPLYRVRKDMAKMKLLGRIFDHGFTLTHMFPKKLCKSSIIRICQPDIIVDQSVIIHDFLLYVTLHERMLLKKALNDYDCLTARDIEQLINLFTTYGFTELPNKAEIEEQIGAIASDVINDKPLQFLREMNKGLHPENVEMYWAKVTLEEISCRLEMQKPTKQKVVDCLKPPEPLNATEDKILYYLQTYILSLNSEDLETFLLFITGSVHMPDEITLAFNNLSGGAIAPKSNTCSNTLHLSTAYPNYSTFKNNLNDFLKSDYSFHYTSI